MRPFKGLIRLLKGLIRLLKGPSKILPPPSKIPPPPFPPFELGPGRDSCPFLAWFLLGKQKRNCHAASHQFRSLIVQEEGFGRIFGLESITRHIVRRPFMGAYSNMIVLYILEVFWGTLRETFG